MLKQAVFQIGCRESSAAFGRLRVETSAHRCRSMPPRQPPSGGCVLKPNDPYLCNFIISQPPSGGCVLKQQVVVNRTTYYQQPPSGGCVLKQVQTITCKES